MDETTQYESEERVRWPENPDGYLINPEERPAPYDVEDLLMASPQRLEKMLQHVQE